MQMRLSFFATSSGLRTVVPSSHIASHHIHLSNHRRKQAHKRPAHPVAEGPVVPETMAGKAEHGISDGLAPPGSAAYAGDLNTLADAALAVSTGRTSPPLPPKEGATSTLLGVLNPPPPVSSTTTSNSSAINNNSGVNCNNSTTGGVFGGDLDRLYTCLLAEIGKLYRQNEETHRTIAQLRDVLTDSRRREQAIEAQLQAVVQHLRAAPASVSAALPPLAPAPHSAFQWDVLNRPRSSSPQPDAPPGTQQQQQQGQQQGQQQQRTGLPGPLLLPDPQLYSGPGLPHLTGSRL